MTRCSAVSTPRDLPTHRSERGELCLTPGSPNCYRVTSAWGEDQLGWDGALIISELATNAIIPGGSAFRASVERSAGIVRIAIEDVGPGLPQSRRALDHALGGRGLAIVEELSDRWGCDRLGGGKVFWVELETT